VMIAHDLFRLSLAEATRIMKRSSIFRHVLFAVGELDDPLEPGDPFIMQAPLPEVEKQWHFSRASVPSYIRLSVGNAARERSLTKLAEEYLLTPAERYRRLKGSVECDQYSVHDPETWDTPFFCVIRIPAELSGNGLPILWLGNRSTALVSPQIRALFFDVRSKVSHGKEAVNFAREIVKRQAGVVN
jgi:hypothetical protein